MPDAALTDAAADKAARAHAEVKPTVCSSRIRARHAPTAAESGVSF
ncbi:MAG: hypothetical protein ACLVB5_01880 [Christensenellales bacterium]